MQSCLSLEELSVALNALSNRVAQLELALSETSDDEQEEQKCLSSGDPSLEIASSKCATSRTLTSPPQLRSHSISIPSEQTPSTIQIKPRLAINRWDTINGKPSITGTQLLALKSRLWQYATPQVPQQSMESELQPPLPLQPTPP